MDTRYNYLCPKCGYISGGNYARNDLPVKCAQCGTKALAVEVERIEFECEQEEDDTLGLVHMKKDGLIRFVAEDGDYQYVSVYLTYEKAKEMVKFLELIV